MSSEDYSKVETYTLNSVTRLPELGQVVLGLQPALSQIINGNVHEEAYNVAVSLQTGDTVEITYGPHEENPGSFPLVFKMIRRID